MSDNGSFLFKNVVLGFGDYDDQDELLHPKMNGPLVDDAVTETQYFGFSVPDERIHGFTYLWHHPNLKTISGGVSGWQGFKSHHLAAEMYDQRMFMSDARVSGNGNVDHFKMDNGYQVDIIEPFKKMRIQYEDAGRKNALDVTYTAVHAPAMLLSRKHFEQTVKTKGSVTLRGKTYAIDGYNIRDRSWGEVRREDAVKFPPLVWLTGAFNDQFSFNCVLTDDPERMPDWAGLYDIKKEETLRGGWIYLDGQYSRIVKSSQLTKRDPVTLQPLSHDLEVVDDKGQRFALKGTVVSSCPSGYWPNCCIFIALVRWECKGLVGWGDSQEAQWTDYVHAMHARR
jgi:hypothetical protein